MKKEYLKKLLSFNYSKEQLDNVETVMSSYEHCTYEQFKELVKTKTVFRTRKLKKPRNLYVCEEGKFWYLDHYYKRYNYCGYFKDDI